MAERRAAKAWAVSYDASGLLQMSEEYDAEALEFLNEHLAKDDFQVLSQDTQGFPGDVVLDFPVSTPDSYRALVLWEKS